MNITKTLSLPMAIAAILGVSQPAYATGQVQVVTPNSSVLKSEDLGFKARTHFKLLVPSIGYAKLNALIDSTPTPFGKPPFAGYGYETPASLACIYKLATPVAGCNPNTVTANASGGSKAIAIVDAFHYPNAKADLTKFSTQFGLPAPNLTVVYASGSQPRTDPFGWEVEEALDIQWAHAMAPKAKIYLVEAKSNSFADLNLAVDKASALVAAAGGGEVSMSYGGSEFSSETSLESHYKKAKVVYFASSGDSAGTSYPCVSPNIVCVGGTTTRRSPSTKNIIQETAWEDTGGGISAYFPRPTYQASIARIVGAKRGVPDVSLVADPNTGGWIYYTASDGSGAGWFIIGGTSWSSPAFAGIVNSAAHFYASSAAELTTIYAGLGSANFRDITAGWCGPYAGWNAVAKWDPCTGVGSDLGKAGK